METPTPAFRNDSFLCPHCGVVSQQLWPHAPLGYRMPDANIRSFVPDRFTVSLCVNCQRPSFWHEKRLVYPSKYPLPPVKSMPKSVREIYEEAQSVLYHSPRASSALMRLAIEQLMCEVAACSGKSLHELIEERKDELGLRLYKMAVGLRLVGNEAVHVGQIDFDEDQEVAELLFYFINRITERLIEEQMMIEKIKGVLPESKAVKLQ